MILMEKKIVPFDFQLLSTYIWILRTFSQNRNVSQLFAEYCYG